MRSGARSQQHPHPPTPVPTGHPIRPRPRSISRSSRVEGPGVEESTRRTSPAASVSPAHASSPPAAQHARSLPTARPRAEPKPASLASERLAQGSLGEWSNVGHGGERRRVPLRLRKVQAGPVPMAWPKAMAQVDAPAEPESPRAGGEWIVRRDSHARCVCPDQVDHAYSRHLIKCRSDAAMRSEYAGTDE